jgi:hypothetical protein
MTSYGNVSERAYLYLPKRVGVTINVGREKRPSVYGTAG